MIRLDFEKYSLYLEFDESGAMVKASDGRPLLIEIPSEYEGRRIHTIARKAFLGNSFFTKIILPESISFIDDWAFAGCSRLNEIVLPPARLGKGVFKDCAGLKALSVKGCKSPDTAALLAEAAKNDTGYLLELDRAGTSEWLKLWDSWLMRFILQPDSEGYSGQVPCGEEDYGSSDVAAYESGRRREKAARILLRLIHDEGLSADLKARLKTYIRDHSAGSTAGDEAWQLILEKHGSDRDYYSAFFEAGAASGESRELVINSIPPEFAEMKSFFINSVPKCGTDLFDTLKL